MTELGKMFLEEALDFLGVSKENFPKFKITVDTNDRGQILIFPYIDYDKAEVHWPMAMEMITPDAKNKPTVFRDYGYAYARRWQQFLINGTRKTGMPDAEELVFSKALNILKGLPNPISYDKITSAVNSLSRRAALQLLKDEFGIECEIKRYRDHKTGDSIELVSLTPDAQRKKGELLELLASDSYSSDFPKINEGDLGSKSNPFDNVDQAADWILNMEREELANNKYRQSIRKEHYFFDPAQQRFRIPWASANVSYYDGPTVIADGFVVNQLDNKKNPYRFSMKPCLKDRLFLFRGQSESWYPECVPGKWRKDSDGNIPDTIIPELKSLELELMLADYPAVKLLEGGLHLFNEDFYFAVNYGGISQHYGNPTEFLDLTSQMEVAKFFAVTSYNKHEDRYEKYTGNDIGVLYYYRLEPDSFIKKEGRQHQLSTIGRQPFMRSGNQHGYLLEMQLGQDFNKLKEVGAVYFRHDSSLTNRIFEESLHGEKYKPTELLGTKWFERSKVKEISNRTVKEYCHRNNLSRSKAEKRVRAAGYKITSKPYTFDREDLKAYYKDSKKLWEDFCDKVYFFSPEGYVLKRHLESVPNIPAYKWAFGE